MVLYLYKRYPETGAAAVPTTLSQFKVIVPDAFATAVEPAGIPGAIIGVFVASQPVPTIPFPDALNATTEIG